MNSVGQKGPNGENVAQNIQEQIGNVLNGVNANQDA